MDGDDDGKEAVELLGGPVVDPGAAVDHWYADQTGDKDIILRIINNWFWEMNEDALTVRIHKLKTLNT